MMEPALDPQAGSRSELVRPSVYYRRYLSTPHNVIRTTKKNLTKESYMKKIFTLALAIITMAFTTTQVMAQPPTLTMKVTSKAFEDGAVIPIKYTSHGDNIQPDFTITGIPAGTVSYAVILHDIDVNLGNTTDDVTHWVAFNIPSPNIPEGSLPAGSVNGNNIRNQPGYMGSGAPNKDRFHHYVFEFYALNANLDLKEGASRADVMAAMQGKVVGKVAYVGRYANARP
jgi:Raf kinase inhibitor-like YbhB/YbcL family protein